tara:strand:+ start:1533 stop:2069 length:537 start_codon:yes stop_codon:yes gene_type:complete
MGPASGYALGGLAQFGMNQMFKPQQYNMGQLAQTLAPQMNSAQYQQDFGKDMMNPNGAYQKGIANTMGLENRNNMLGRALMNQRSAGQYGNSALSAKLNQSNFRDADQSTSQGLASMLPQLTQQGSAMYQQGVGNMGDYLSNLGQGQLANTDMNNAWGQKQLSMMSPFTQKWAGALGK